MSQDSSSTGRWDNLLERNADFKTSIILDKCSIYLICHKPRQYPEATKQVIQSQLNIK